jgi:hypothetical protein
LGYMTHYLAEAEWQAATNSIYPIFTRTTTASKTMLRCYDDLAAELAQQALDRFFFVGLTEQAAESIAILNRLLAAYGLALTGQMGHENRSHEGVGDMRWLKADDEIGRRALQHAEVDAPLYQYGLRRMERQRADAAAVNDSIRGTE